MLAADTLCRAATATIKFTQFAQAVQESEVQPLCRAKQTLTIGTSYH